MFADLFSKTSKKQRKTLNLDLIIVLVCMKDLSIILKQVRFQYNLLYLPPTILFNDIKKEIIRINGSLSSVYIVITFVPLRRNIITQPLPFSVNEW